MASGTRQVSGESFLGAFKLKMKVNIPHRTGTVPNDQFYACVNTGISIVYRYRYCYILLFK